MKKSLNAKLEEEEDVELVAWVELEENKKTNNLEFTAD